MSNIYCFSNELRSFFIHYLLSFPQVKANCRNIECVSSGLLMPSLLRNFKILRTTLSTISHLTSIIWRNSDIADDNSSGSGIPFISSTHLGTYSKRNQFDKINQQCTMILKFKSCIFIECIPPKIAEEWASPELENVQGYMQVDVNYQAQTSICWVTKSSTC